MSTIRWGIVGAGRVAHDFADGLRAAPGAVLTAVTSRTPEGAARLAQRHGQARIHASVEALAADPDVDVVYVGSPNPHHHVHCAAALNAGKAVLCEKPFASNAEEARRVVALARDKRLFCMEAMWMRFLPAMDRARSLLAAGAIGELRMLNASFGFAAPYLKDNRFFNAALGGGAFADVGVYPLSLAVHLLGMPARIQASARLGPSGVDEQSAALLSYPGGELALLSASLRASLPTEAVITGTRGEIRLWPLFRPEHLAIRTFSEAGNYAAPAAGGGGLRARLRLVAPLRLAVRRARKAARLALRGPDRVAGPVERFPFLGNGYTHEALEVMRCLREGLVESPLMPLAETLTVMECLDLIHAEWHGG